MVDHIAYTLILKPHSWIRLQDKFRRQNPDKTAVPEICVSARIGIFLLNYKLLEKSKDGKNQCPWLHLTIRYLKWKIFYLTWIVLAARTVTSGWEWLRDRWKAHSLNLLAIALICEKKITSRIRMLNTVMSDLIWNQGKVSGNDQASSKFSEFTCSRIQK